MKPDYSDITKRLGEPLWWDENGVPRYEPFHPDMCNVYADYVVLMVVECQNCGRQFKVAVSCDKYSAYPHGIDLPIISDEGSFGYGDPPRHGMSGNVLECLAGDTMGSLPVMILEFWERPNHKWQRNPKYEIEFEIDWGEYLDLEKGD